MRPKTEVKISVAIEHWLSTNERRGTSGTMIGKIIPIDPSVLEKPGELEEQIKGHIAELARRNTVIE